MSGLALWPRPNSQTSEIEARLQLNNTDTFKMSTLFVLEEYCVKNF